MEYDLYLGHASSLGVIDYDAALIYYWYPNDRGDSEADYVEFALDLSHTFENIAMKPTIGVSGAYSPDATLEDDTYTYFKSYLAFQLGEYTGIDFAVGSADVDLSLIHI